MQLKRQVSSLSALSVTKRLLIRCASECFTFLRTIYVYIFQVEIRKGNSCYARYSTSHEKSSKQFRELQHSICCCWCCWTCSLERFDRFVRVRKKVHWEPFLSSQMITSIHKSSRKWEWILQLNSWVEVLLLPSERTYVAFGKLETMALQTADFIDKINRLFDVMNSQTHQSCHKQMEETAVLGRVPWMAEILEIHRNSESQSQVFISISWWIPYNSEKHQNCCNRTVDHTSLQLHLSITFQPGCVWEFSLRYDPKAAIETIHQHQSIKPHAKMLQLIGFFKPTARIATAKWIWINSLDWCRQGRWWILAVVPPGDLTTDNEFHPSDPNTDRINNTTSAWHPHI